MRLYYYKRGGFGMTTNVQVLSGGNPRENYIGCAEDGKEIFSAEGDLRTHIRNRSLSSWNRLKVWMFGRAYVGTYRALASVAPDKYYLFFCRKCRTHQVDFIHGTATLICFACPRRPHWDRGHTQQG